jgi:hypothetical protein
MKDKDVLALWNSVVVGEDTMTHGCFEAQIIRFYHAVRKEKKKDKGG